MGRLIVSGNTETVRSAGELQIGSYTGEYTVDENGWIRFLSSGELRVKSTTVIDAFLVGGGGAAASDVRDGTSTSRFVYMSPGGGGGYTVTKRAFTLYPHKKYSIVIGDGGKYYTANSSAAKNGGRGDTTSAFGVSAEGGYGGSFAPDKGGDGGSGGGAWGDASYTGGIDGADGNGGSESRPGGTGQGRTTRAFEEENGELFASGGNGGYSGGLSPEITPNPQAGASNTGNGGDGDCYWTYKDSKGTTRYNYKSGKSGGSGIVIIRRAVA